MPLQLHVLLCCFWHRCTILAATTTIASYGRPCEPICPVFLPFCRLSAACLLLPRLLACSRLRHRHPERACCAFDLAYRFEHTVGVVFVVALHDYDKVMTTQVGLCLRVRAARSAMLDRLLKEFLPI
jgi:hypothetical protein